MQKQKIFLVSAVLMTGLYIVWMIPGWWNLGLSIINTIYLALVWFYNKKAIRKNRYLQFLGIASLVLGWFMAIRSFEFVRTLTWLTIIILNVLVSTLCRTKRASLSLDRLVRTMTGLIGKTFGAWKELVGVVASKNRGSQITKIVVGVAISIPLLLVFGSLFYAADPIFGKMVDQIKWPQIKLNQQLILNIITSGLFFGWVLSNLRARLAKKIEVNRVLKQITEVNVAVAIVEILFLWFTIIQIRYFWATPTDLRNMGIIFSEYTRSGYTQMIIASLLAYGIVMLLEYSIRSQKRLGQVNNWLTKALSLAIIGEILIFVLAATKRNYTYQSVYGFTEIRLLGFALSLWLIAMLGLILFKIIKQKGQNWFVREIIVVTTLAIIGLNWFDIDGTIVRTKPASLDNGIDYRYLTTLSNDTYGELEMIFKGVESRIEEAGSNRDSINYYWDVDVMVNNLSSRKDVLAKQSENNWHWGGSWNYADYRASLFFESNKNRIEKMRARIKEFKSEVVRRQNETNAESQMIWTYINQVSAYCSPIASCNVYHQGTQIFININKELTEEQINRVPNVTAGKCKIGGTTRVEKVNSTNRYTYMVNCTK